MAGISNDVENLRVNRVDFMRALDEVHPAFGVAEEELQQVIQNGIIHFHPVVDVRVLFSLKGMFLTSFCDNKRNFYAMEHSSWTRYGLLRGHRWSACFFMVHRDLGRRLWLQQSHRLPSSPSSSLSLLNR